MSLSALDSNTCSGPVALEGAHPLAVHVRVRVTSLFIDFFAIIIVTLKCGRCGETSGRDAG